MFAAPQGKDGSRAQHIIISIQTYTHIHKATKGTKQSFTSYLEKKDATVFSSVCFCKSYGDFVSLFRLNRSICSILSPKEGNLEMSETNLNQGVCSGDLLQMIDILFVASYS